MNFHEFLSDIIQATLYVEGSSPSRGINGPIVQRSSTAGFHPTNRGSNPLGTNTEAWPNGKALVFGTSIFQVRVLASQLYRAVEEWFLGGLITLGVERLVTPVQIRPALTIGYPTMTMLGFNDKGH